MVKTSWLNKTLTEVIQTLTEASWINSNQSIVPIYVYTHAKIQITEESISLKIFSKLFLKTFSTMKSDVLFF